MLHKPFLTAEWKYLVMINYEVDPARLRPLLPAGTQLDQWNSKTYISLVGFLFLDTRIKGITVPFHRNFEEINLRFYVKRELPGESRRGVVFVKEIVPRRAIATIARHFYNENYVCLPMQHRIDLNPETSSVEYSCKLNGTSQRMRAQFSGKPAELGAGSQEEFITEHYWGYTKQRDGGTMEYHVEHPKWQVWSAEAFDLDVEDKALYGAQFESAFDRKPSSVFIATGSRVTVSSGVRL